ncbi:MAG: hypothetical protein IJ722_03915 [Alloprevotella sp.]|nr:hypothetical protein [Alloprevotella sp.]
MTETKQAYVPLKAKLISYDNDGVLFTASSRDKLNLGRIGYGSKPVADKFEAMCNQDYDTIKRYCSGFACQGYTSAAAQYFCKGFSYEPKECTGCSPGGTFYGITWPEVFCEAHNNSEEAQFWWWAQHSAGTPTCRYDVLNQFFKTDIFTLQQAIGENNYFC